MVGKEVTVCFFLDNINNLNNLNNTVENDFFGFPRVKWLQYTGRWANVQAVDVKFSPI